MLRGRGGRIPTSKSDGRVRERDIIKMLMDFMDTKGILYVRHHPVKMKTINKKTFMVPVRPSQKGAPDLIAFPKAMEGKYVAIECKAPGKDLSDDQRDWKDRCLRSGGKYWIVDTVDEVMNSLKGLFKGPRNTNLGHE